jgi:hypothetical protein
VSERYGNGPRWSARSPTAATDQSTSCPASCSAPGSTPAVTRTPSGVVRSSVVNLPTATLTSRAAGSADVHVRRPSRAAEGSVWTPVISTVRSSGADTSMRVSAAGLVVVSPLISTKGSSAQPTPGSQASRGAPLAHHDTPSSVPTRSKAAEPRETVKSSSTRVVSPAASSPSRSTTYSPPGSAAPARSYRPAATSSPRTSATSRRLPASAESGALGVSRNTSSSTGRSGVNVTVSVPVTVRRSSSSRKSSSTLGRSGSGSDRSAGQENPASALPSTTLSSTARSSAARVSAKEVHPGRTSRPAATATAARRDLMPERRSPGPGRAPSPRRWSR